jgi:formamidopyrimidine-DNA glycosylase
MPESPELKTSCDHLRKIICGKTIINSFFSKNGRYSKKIPENYNSTMQCSVLDINVKGKFMYWSLSNGQYMFCTYGMTGQWENKEDKHTCFTLQYVDKFESIDQAISDFKFLYFNDPRHFGTIKFVNSKQELLDKLDSLGWDPLSEDISSKIEWLKNKINKSTPIGQILMDQSIFCGVGNYIRAEALYRSRISPWKKGKELTNLELISLCDHIYNVMNESYQAQGASFSTYQNVDGNAGKYSFNFQVYSQKKDPLGYNIIREKMGTRTIHWCPEMQRA